MNNAREKTVTEMTDAIDNIFDEIEIETRSVEDCLSNALGFLERVDHIEIDRGIKDVENEIKEALKIIRELNRQIF